MTSLDSIRASGQVRCCRCVRWKLLIRVQVRQDINMSLVWHFVRCFWLFFSFGTFLTVFQPRFLHHDRNYGRDAVCVLHCFWVTIVNHYNTRHYVILRLKTFKLHFLLSKQRKSSLTPWSFSFLLCFSFLPHKNMCIVPAENHYLTICYCYNGSGHYILKTKMTQLVAGGVRSCLCCVFLLLPLYHCACSSRKQWFVLFISSSVCVAGIFREKDKKNLIYVSHQHCRDIWFRRLLNTDLWHSCIVFIQWMCLPL